MLEPIIPVFYDERMCAPSGGYSPSSEKPRLVVQDWLKSNYPIRVQSFEPVSRDTLTLAHGRSHVDTVLDLHKTNGFDNKSPELAATFPWTVGSMVAAATLAIGHRENCVCSPTSGFHHAGYGYGDRFCTFNGLVVAAMHLKNLGLVSRVAIIDCDYHYGDGTADIISRLGIKWIRHWTVGEHYRFRDDAKPFLRELYRNAADLIHGTNLVLYQAGADAHIDDPLGGFLTTEQMIQRDRIVLWVAREFRVPIVWNLAGGYQRDAAGSIAPVLDLHRHTLDQAVRLFVQHEPEMRL